MEQLHDLLDQTHLSQKHAVLFWRVRVRVRVSVSVSVSVSVRERVSERMTLTCEFVPDLAMFPSVSRAAT